MGSSWVKRSSLSLFCRRHTFHLRNISDNMSSIKILTIIGPGESASESDRKMAFESGRSAAEAGLTVLTGGRPSGVMEAALKGAKSADGTTIAVLPGKKKSGASEYADIVIPTGMGQARNVINILSGDLILSVGLGPGTLSEIALAVKEKKSLILMNASESVRSLIKELDYNEVIYVAEVKDLDKYLIRMR